MKRILVALAALGLLFGSPTVAQAKGYSGGGSYRSGSSFGGFGSHSYSLSGSPFKSSGSGGMYHSGVSPYSSSANNRSGGIGGGTYHSGYLSPSSGIRTRSGWFSSGSRGLGWGHLASFGGGLLLGSLLHPFGWGFGGGSGWNYSPMWSIFGTILDLLLVGLVIWIIYQVLRALPGRKRVTVAPVYQGFFGSTPLSRDVDEQAVIDACCELVALRRGCAPQQVEIDLTFNRDTNTFGADVSISGRRAYPLHEQDLVDAIANFVEARERVDHRKVDVDLRFNEGLGIYASVRIA